MSFLVVDPRGHVVSRSTARVRLARSLAARPFTTTLATLEPIGVPGESSGADATAIYVAHVRVPTAGKYQLVARPVDGRERIAGVAELDVAQRSASPMVGSRAYPSRTPTLASAHDRVDELTTRVPPDRALLRMSIAAALAAHAPFVVTFATPRYCESRICGARSRRGRPGSQAIRPHAGALHPRGDLHRQQSEQGTEPLGARVASAGEPWTFLVGRDGRIKAKFQGSVSVGELNDAIRRLLL